MLLTDGHGTPISIHVDSASPHEVKLIEILVMTMLVLARRRTKLIYDKAADSDPLRRRLSNGYGLTLIAPYRKHKGMPRKRLTERQRKLYRHRYKIERTNAWMKWYRRLQVRQEYHSHLYKGFWMLGFVFTMLKAF